MTATSANFPNPGSPIVGPDGRLSPEWYGFFLSLFNRTGGTGTPPDLTTLQNQLTAQEAEISDLFVLGNSQIAASLVGALLSRVVTLEMALQGVVPVRQATPQTLPEAVPVSRTSQALPDPVAIRQKDNATDIYKMVSR